MATKPAKGAQRPASKLPWVITAVAVVGLAAALMVGRRPSGPAHPEPRADAASLGESLMPASFFTSNPRVLRTYQLARDVPAVLDGIYCYCHCKEELGHRSLISCFQSQHGAGCDICLAEADMAEQMHAQGKSLADIRAQIDLAYGR